MADDDTRRSLLDEVKQMRANGLTKKTPLDAPQIELTEDFWRNAVIVETAAARASTC